MSIVAAVIVPHPPVILPEVGKGREQEVSKTTEAYMKAAGRVAALKPEALVISSPHSPAYADYFHFSPGDEAFGSMANFGAPRLRFHAKYDAELRAETIRLAEAEGLSAGTLGGQYAELDHGVCVPLYFLRKAGVRCPVVRLGLSGFSPAAHYRLGVCIARAAEKLDRRVVYIASGDLSHKLTDDGPYGFAPEGPAFDREATRAMAEGDFLRLLTLEPSLCERAAECGLNSFRIMAGALDGLAVRPELLSYEGPLGVGYAVAVFTVTGRDANRRFAGLYEERERERLERQKAAEDPYVRLARLSLETYVGTGKPLEALPDDLPSEMLEKRAGAFVSLHLREQLRGCVGTIAPTEASVAAEIVANAVAAGAHDTRFPPVREDELASLEYSVDVLGTPEKIAGPEMLDVKRYGVIVSCGRKRGLLLPDLEGVDTVEKQVIIARGKANIDRSDPYTLERFEVVRHR